MTCRRGTSNANLRGSSAVRRARRARLWRRCAWRGRVPCWWCNKRLCKAEFQVDRLVCGHDGGSYSDANIVPACPKCNRDRCALVCGRGVAARRAERP